MTDPGRMATIPEWRQPGEEKINFQEHKEEGCIYNECRVVDTPLKNQIFSVFEDAYMLTIKDAYTGYTTNTTLNLITHLDTHYTCISATDM